MNEGYQQLINDVLRKRYYLRDENGKLLEETPEEMFERVAVAIAKVEDDPQEWEKKFYDLMVEKRFLPNSPTLVNAGTEFGTLSACFVIPVEDSLEGIYKALTDAAKVHKAFGGTGFSFSRLRPKGDVIGSTGGSAAGPVAFMKLFDASADAVRQGGRREGANMGILDVNHPDIEEFIVCKDREGTLRHFNISVAVTHSFMLAMRDGLPFPLINRRTREVVKMINPSELFDKIAYQAWKNGEPGVVFIDTINMFNTCPHLGRIEATNPCLTGDMLVPTANGLKRMDQIRIGDRIWVYPGKFEVVMAVYDLGEQDVYEIVTERGYTLRGTADHKIMTDQGLKRISELNIGDLIEAQEEGYLPEGGDFELGFLAGIIYGDGWVSDDRLGITFHEADREIAEYVLRILRDCFGVTSTIREYTQRSGNVVLRIHTGKKAAVEFAKKAKSLEIILEQPREFIRGFISGWLFADGHVESGNSMHIAVSCKHREHLEILATCLLQFGIMISNIYTVKRKGHPSDAKYGFTAGDYVYYRLHITGEDVQRLVDEIPLYGALANCLNVKRKKRSVKERKWQRIVAIQYKGRERVYDFTTDGNKLFYANGIRNLDCGEQPLLPYESCNLGSINLSAHVNDGEIDWDRLEKTIRIAVRFLDDVITVNKYPIPEIEKATLRTRKIGLGVMGWHDTLIKLGVSYDSEQALRLAEQIMSFIQNVSVDESMNLAEERGPFPAFEGSWWDHEGSNPLRNATTTTIAPTGSISLIAGCSPSIEPVFQWSYIRRTEYGEYEVVHPLLVELYGEDWKDKINAGSGMFKTALDIHWEWHIRMQAAFQKYTHNAVSKTINMPRTATVEDVKRAIMMAWKLECKGITIYRVGSRQEEVMSVKQTMVDRPKKLSGETYKARSGCGKMYVTINRANGKPYEVFVRTAGGCEANNEAIGRLISLALRNGIPVERVIRQLRKVKCINAMRSEKSEGRSCADVIGRLLEQFVSGEKSVEDEGRRCPECGAKLTFGEGCMTGSCPNCGWSGCG